MKRKPRKGKIVAAARDAQGKLKPTASMTKLRNASMAELQRLVAAEEKRNSVRQSKLDKAEERKWKAGEKAKEKALRDEEKAKERDEKKAAKAIATAEAKALKAEERKWAAGKKASEKADALEEWHALKQQEEAAAISQGVKSFDTAQDEKRMKEWQRKVGIEGRPSKAKAAAAAKAWYQQILDDAVKGAVAGAKKNLLDRLKDGIKGK